MNGKVVLIDDDAPLLAAQTQALELEGFTVEAFASGPEALKALDTEFAGVIVTDVRMPVMDGLEVFRRVRLIDADIPVILMTGHGDVPMAVQALKDGAYDFLAKPFAQDELDQAIRRALQTRELVLENRALRQAHAQLFDREQQNLLLGETPVMIQLKQVVMRVAEAEVNVLITGDSGVGKERVAHALHALSPRKGRAFVHVGCAMLEEEHFHAELFGSETSARAGGGRQAGRMEKAHRGTLFLDEVDRLTLPQQARLLHVLETGEIWSVGADSPRHIDVRMIAATRADLAQAVREGRFRADLYYRLSGVSLRVPSLSDRREDTDLLFQHFLMQAAARLDRPVPGLTLAVKGYLRRHDWPGNVRELEQFAERFVLGLADTGLVSGASAAGLAQQVAEYEAAVITETLEAQGGNVRQVMETLRLPRKTFYDKVKKYRIDLNAFRQGRSA